MFSPNKIFILIGVLIATTLFIARISLFMDGASEDMMFKPPECYQIGKRISFKEFISNYLPALKASGAMVKLPDTILEKYIPSDVWICSGNVFIIAYSDGVQINTYYDAPVAIEVAIFPNLSSIHTPIVTQEGETVKLDMVYPSKAFKYNGFEVIVIDRSYDSESQFDYMFTIYDVDGNVRYNIGFRKGYSFTETDITKILSSFREV